MYLEPTLPQKCGNLKLIAPIVLQVASDHFQPEITAELELITLWWYIQGLQRQKDNLWERIKRIYIKRGGRLSPEL